MNLEDINKQQEEYNEFLKKKGLHLKQKVTFSVDDELEEAINNLKNNDSFVFIDDEKMDHL